MHVLSVVVPGLTAIAPRLKLAIFDEVTPVAVAAETSSFVSVAVRLKPSAATDKDAIGAAVSIKPLLDVAVAETECAAAVAETSQTYSKGAVVNSVPVAV